MAKGSAAAAAKPAAKEATKEPGTSANHPGNVIEYRDVPTTPGMKTGPMQEPKVLAVKFERDRPLVLPGIGTVDYIDLRPMPGRGGRPGRPSKWDGLVTLALRGPLLLVRFKRGDQSAFEAVPVVGCVRQISFDPGAP